jgi:predicted Zn-dependent peptidase
MDDGGKLAVSSRGMGSLVKKNGANYVNDDFYLATAADIVADPSAPNAFVEGIMEGKEWVWNNGLLQEQEVARIKDEMEQNIRSRKANYQALAFAKFLKNL